VADLNTNINIVIQNLKKVKDLGKTFKDAAKDAERIENKIKAINANLNRAKQKFNTVDPDMPRDKKGRFVKDADRNRRRNAYAELRYQKWRQLTEKRSVQRDLDVIQRKQRLIKREEAGALKRAQIEQRILTQRLQLSAAKGLVGRKIREAGSAGLSPVDFAGGEGQRPSAKRVELNAQVQKLKQGFKELQEAEVEVGSTTDRNGKITARNIQTYRALGSELSRVVEQLNALNRASAKRSIGFEKGRRLQERIAAIDPIKRKTKSGAEIAGTGKARDFGQGAAAQRARGLASKVIAAADTGDQNLYNQALSKATAAISRLEREYKQGEKALKEERRLRKIGVKARRRAASKRADIQGRFRESLMLGAGFPLLFGGGVGAVAGGIGGAIAQKGGKGFGAQIFFSAIGQQFDRLVSSMVSSTAKLGQALGQYNQNTEQLITSLGLAGTAEGQRIQIIETLQGKQAAFNAAMQQLVNAVGEKGAADLKKFGDNLRLVGSEFRIFFTKVQAGLAGILNLADKILRFSEGAQESRVSRFAETTTNSEIAALRDRRDKILQSSGGGRSGAKNRADSVKEIEAEMQRLAAPALARQDAGTAVDTIMLKQKELTKTLEEEFAVHAKILELQEKKGLSAELAKSVAQEAVTIDKTTEALQERFNELKDKGINKTLEEVELQKAIKQALDGQSDALDKIIQKKKNINTESEFIKVKWEDIKETIASGLTSAIEGLIAGTKSLGESLAGIAKSIASMYLKAAIMNMLPMAEGGYVSNGIKPFSSGGMVTKPTMGLVGEAGEDEYIIPASKMAQSMQRYSAGARGEAVIPGTGSSYAGGGAGGSTTVSYSGPILNFNSEEFVPKSAVGQIIATATSQGARAGEARALSSLQNSRSRRSNIGL
jgi:hypothetical protein